MGWGATPDGSFRSLLRLRTDEIYIGAKATATCTQPYAGCGGGTYMPLRSPPYHIASSTLRGEGLGRIPAQIRPWGCTYSIRSTGLTPYVQYSLRMVYLLCGWDDRVCTDDGRAGAIWGRGFLTGLCTARREERVCLRLRSTLW